LPFQAARSAPSNRSRWPAPAQSFPLQCSADQDQPALQARYPLTPGVNPRRVTLSVMLPTLMEVLN